MSYSRVFIFLFFIFLAFGEYVLKTGVDNPFDSISESNSSPTFVDLDGDADLDLVLGSNSKVSYFRNNGDGTFTERTGTDNPFGVVAVGTRLRPAFVNLDGDADFDLVVGSDDGTLSYFVIMAMRHSLREREPITLLTL